jgi:hypothetical protein
MRSVTPALSACRRPLHRRLVESEKPTASPQRSPATANHQERFLLAGLRFDRVVIGGLFGCSAPMLRRSTSIRLTTFSVDGFTVPVCGGSWPCFLRRIST